MEKNPKDWQIDLRAKYAPPHSPLHKGTFSSSNAELSAFKQPMQKVIYFTPVLENALKPTTFSRLEFLIYSVFQNDLMI